MKNYKHQTFCEFKDLARRAGIHLIKQFDAISFEMDSTLADTTEWALYVTATKARWKSPEEFCILIDEVLSD